MGLRSWSAAAALTLLGTLLFAVSSAGAASEAATKTYIVTMLQEAAIAYDGGVAGLPATKPARGKKLDRTAADVERYVGHLRRSHDAALAEVGGAETSRPRPATAARGRTPSRTRARGCRPPPR